MRLTRRTPSPSPSPARALAACALVLALAVLALPACVALAAKAPKSAKSAPGLRWITLAELKKSLAKKPPSTVVFDIDDTALYSTLAFLYAQGAFDAPTRGNAFKDPYFWTLVNDSLDARWSRPKAIADSLITLHVARGDTVAFVSSRNESTPPSDKTSLLMQRLFRIPYAPRVVFTNQKPKVDAIRALHPTISYGDADGDIKDTWAADSTIRAIRVVRTWFSSNPSPHEPGSQGEEILIDSDR